MALLSGLLILWIPLAQSRPVSDPSNPHNLSIGATHGRTQANDGSQFGADEICIFCHTPHSATALGPLWNRAEPDNMGSFPLYNSSSLKIKDIPAAQYNTTDYPNGASKLCLSCHDGVTGIGTLLDRTITMNRETMSDVPTSTTFDPVIDLELTHPVSFVFNDTVETALLGKASIPTDPDLRDSQERVQCTSCHDPHDDRGEALYDSAGVPPFWRIISTDPANSYTDLCNKCHGTFGIPSGDHHTADFPR
ncbi:MAG: hypothetical protein A2X84_02800 [Desulfuromonadaceae bacterium GWC2_58_13]|nr:MAG: hypothetical protein A2X84_02800 [Desulfuromonadaceae bacterium GWC2_58_13]